jgi:glycosyltransferase involved in cell wall biosynthesis
MADSMASRFAALIPCYNVGKACVPVISRTAAMVEVCAVVDDGSSDDTLQNMQSVEVSNVVFLRHARNMGKGAALQTGFRALLEKGIDGVLTLDGDGQHDPEQVPAFIEEFRSSGADLIIGNRMMNQAGMPAHRRWLNGISNRLLSRICRRTIQDSQCGFRLYSTRLLKSIMAELKSARYELETEILIKASRSGMNVRFVPIRTIYSRETNRLSNHSFLDVLRIAKLLFSHFP